MNPDTQELQLLQAHIGFFKRYKERFSLKEMFFTSEIFITILL